MGIAKDFKFGVLIDHQAYKSTNAKVFKKVSSTSRDLLFFSDLSTSVEQHSLLGMRLSFNFVNV